MRVPTYDERQVEIRPLPDVRPAPPASAEAFGAGVGETVAGAADAAARLYRQELDKQRRIVLTRAVGDLAGAEYSLLHDPRTGAFSRVGTQAFGVTDEAAAAYAAAARKIAEGLDPETRQVFEAHAAERLPEVQTSLARWEGRQRDVVDEETTQSAAATLVRSAAAKWTDPAAVEKEMRLLEGVVAGRVARAGLPQAVADDRLLQARTAVHGAVVEQMLGNGQAIAAKRWVEAHAGQMDPAAAAKLLGQLRPISDRQEAQAIADDLWTRNGGRYGDALGAARKTYADSELRPQIEELLRTRSAQDEESTTLARKDARAAVLGRALKSGVLGAKEWGADIKALTPDDVLSIQDRWNAHMEQRAALASSRRDERESAQLTSQYVAYKLMQLRQDDPAAFRKIDLFDLRSYPMTHDDRQRLLELQLKPERESPGGVRLRSASQVLHDVMDESGLLPTGKEPTPAENPEAWRKYAEIRGRYEQWLATFPRGKEPSAEQEEEYLRRFTTRVVLRRTRLGMDWFAGDDAMEGPKKLKTPIFAATLTKDQLEDAYVRPEDVDPADWVAVKKSLTAVGRPEPDDFAVGNAYVRAVGGFEPQLAVALANDREMRSRQAAAAPDARPTTGGAAGTAASAPVATAPETSGPADAPASVSAPPAAETPVRLRETSMGPSPRESLERAQIANRMVLNGVTPTPDLVTKASIAAASGNTEELRRLLGEPNVRR